MDRREFLTGMALTGVMAVTAGAAEHGAHGAMGPNPPDPKLAKIVETSLDCVKTGDACVRHCVEVLGSGDTSLKECLKSVLDLVAVCDSMAKVASYSAGAPSKTLAAYIAACAQYCRDCSAACKKHAEHHEVCKACMESCDRCVKACDAAGV